MLKAVIFDFDGVITDSELLHMKAFNIVLGRFNICVSEDEYFESYLGLSDRDFFDTLNQKNSLGLSALDIDQLFLQKKESFESIAETECEIIDGVVDFLRLLKDNELPMAIYSGALQNEIQIVLRGNGLDKYFPVIVSAEDVENCKPAPDGFLLALSKLNDKLKENISPDECIVIEDSQWGIDAACAANMHTVAVTNSYPAEELNNSDVTCDNLSDLRIEQLQNICE